MTDLDRGAFRAGYSSFLRPGRVLLTGHSHQAWPDAARAAQLAYFDDAARYVDTKWDAAVFPKLDAVGRRVLARLGFPEDDAIAFGKSTHELLYRLLSSFGEARPLRVVSTTSEFYSLDRQLTRLAEAGAHVTWVDAQPREGLAARLCEAIVPGVDVVAFSAVLFEDGYVVPGIGEVIARAEAVGALPVVDAYHAFNVVPLDLGPRAEAAFVTAAGYKYAQFGEGAAFLRLPRATALRPVYTGWFSAFDSLTGPREKRRVSYGEGGMRFAGATFDASAFYRADAALENFDRFGLDVPRLRALSLAMTGRLLERLDARGVIGPKAALVSPRDPARRGGFVTLRIADAARVVSALRERDVFTDSRGDLLRLGPAPYLSDAEIDRGVDLLAELLLGQCAGAGGKPGRPDGIAKPPGIADGMSPGGMSPGGIGRPPGAVAVGAVAGGGAAVAGG